MWKQFVTEKTFLLYRITYISHIDIKGYIYNLNQTGILKFVYTIALIISSSLLFAQEHQDEDSVAVGQVDKSQIYISTSYSAQQFSETFASFVNISMGISFKKQIDLSIYYGWILNNFKKQIIFPTSFYYEQQNIGLQFQHEFTDHKIRPLAGLEINYTQLAWKSEGDLDDLFTDNFLIYSGYLGGAWTIGKILTVQGSIGYSWPGEVEIVGLNTEDFQGMNFNFAIKMGVFRF